MRDIAGQVGSTAIVGVSPDKQSKQAKFDTKHGLGYPLLADEDHSVAQAYDVWREKSMYGKKYWGAARTTFVIGKDGRDIPADRALEYVFGYTAANDVSARDLQMRHGGQFFKGKSLDTFCPLGPWIVTADEIADPHAMTVATRVNGVEKQRSNTRELIFNVPDTIALLSAGLTLEAGDIVLTGTPHGVGMARNPQEWLKDGDVVEVEVEGVGVLRNRVRTRGRG